MTMHRPRNMQSWLINVLLCANLVACTDNRTTPPSPVTTPIPAQVTQNNSVTASLSTPFALAQQKNCVVCHSINNKMVGPSWVSVSEHYKNDKNAVDTLTTRILNGGSGTFGAVVMPPQTSNLTPEEAKHLAQWVLTLK